MGADSSKVETVQGEKVEDPGGVHVTRYGRGESYSGCRASIQTHFLVPSSIAPTAFASLQHDKTNILQNIAMDVTDPEQLCIDGFNTKLKKKCRHVFVYSYHVVALYENRLHISKVLR